MSPEETLLTREQLYERVWSEPLHVLAKQFGLSDVGLAKACKRMHIPLPGRGHWAKQQAGHKVRQTPLPNLAAHIRVPALSMRRSRPADELAGPVDEQRHFESRAENTIQVADTLVDPHALVRQSVVAFRGAKPGPSSFLVPKSLALNVSVTVDSVDRAMCILDALLKALDARGFPPAAKLSEPTQYSSPRHPITWALVNGEEVRFSLVERIAVVEIPPKPGRPSIFGPERERVPTGELTLQIDEWCQGVRRTWSDGKKQRVETCLNQFIVGLVAAAEGVRSRRLENEAREREWREAEERRAAEGRRKAAEAQRVKCLMDALREWRDAHDIRQLAQEMRAALATSDSPDRERVERFVAWATEYVDRHDPLKCIVLPPDI